MVEQKSSPSPIRTLPSTVPAQGAKAQGAPSNKVKQPARKSGDFSSMPFWFGLFLSISWTGIVAFVLFASGPAHTFGGVPLINWSIALSAIASPVALIWMVTAYLQRAADIQSIAEPLRRQLSMITGESGAAEVRIRRFNQAIREQLETLRSAQTMTHDDLVGIMDRVRQHRNELERFEHDSIHQVKEIQEIVRRNMQQVEQLMDDKFTMLRVLDDKLIQSGDGVSRQTEAVRDQITNLLSEIESNSQHVAMSVERAMRDSKKLSDTSRAQEASLLTAAESASDTLSGLSGKIDLNIARFLERAGTAREEAERLAATLDAQTRSLDEFSNTMPTRVSEAESVLRGVADRLYASEQLAREQAVHLSEKLALQVDSLQQLMDKFGVRLNDIDSNLQQRRSDLDGLISRIGEATGNFTVEWQNSINNLSDTTTDTLSRFMAVNQEARKGADDVATHLSATAERYESAATQLNTLSEASSAQLRSMTSEISTHVAQFEALRNASEQAGQEVQNRAAAAMQNLQHVLERLLASREATQAVGDTLVERLFTAVTQNEQLIGRLNEAAQMSVRALGIATESLGKQENELTDQTRVAEAMLREATTQLQQQAQVAEIGLRAQASSLMALLNETQEKLYNTDQKMQDFAARAVVPVQQVMLQIDANTDKGLQSMGRYGDGLQEQLNRLQQFNSRVTGMGEELHRVTGETLGTIEQLNNRFTSARTAQEETARAALDQFNTLADRLQREISSLGEQTGQAVGMLQQAAARVGDQSQHLLNDAQSSGAQMQVVTAALQNEATQIRSILQKQADDLSTDLSRAEKQFTTLGESLKQRTDAAFALLDRVAEHYNEVTRGTAQDLEDRATRLENVASQAQGKVEAYNAALVQQLSLIGNGTTQLEANSTQIGSTNNKTMQQLSALNEKLVVTHEAANVNSQQTIARLEETNNAFMRQSNSLNEAAQSSVILIQKATTNFGEQASKMLDTSHQTEQHVRSLSSTTVALAEQSAQIRTSMEQQNQRLIAQLTEAVMHLETTDAKLQQAVASAIAGSDHAAARLGEVTQTASNRLNTSHQELKDIASKTETTLAALGSNITQQAASLSVVGDQLGEQYRSLSAANENQRTQLVELFDKLGAAHGQASEVAERTINRLTDALQQIQRQLGVLSDQSQSTIANVRTAGTGFADQSGLLLQHAQQAEQQARSVLTVTSSLQEQARQLRDVLHGEGERASDLLGGLLGKLSSGSIELRDISSNAEMTLTSLQNNLGQQTLSLNSSMQQIADRQRTLTTSLDAQRDVLNGLLSRLALAQDETAATTERTVARLTDGTQQISKQLEAIDSQSQNTLTSVRAASAGFADEAGALSLHAQQAEQQMRAVLSVTAGMQDQARQLRESMQNETARVLEQLNSVIAQLDNTSGQLKQQSGSIIHTMDQSALQFTALSRNGTETLLKQAETLAQVTAQAEARITSTGDKIRGHLKLVSDAGEQTEQQARQLADAAEFASTRLATLRDGMSETDKNSRGAMASISAHIDEVRATLQNELKQLADTSQLAVQQVAAATQNLTTQSDSLRANLASSESALVQAATLVRDETVQLPATLDRSTAQIEAAGEAIKNQTADVNNALVATADRFISVTGATRETMVEEMRRVGTVAESADQLLRQFNKSVAEQISTIKQSTTLLSTEQQELVGKATQTIAQLTAASDRLAQLRGDATQTAEKLAREFDALETRAASTSQRLSQTGDIVGKQMDNLVQATQRAEGQLLIASNSFREQLERVRSGVQTQIDDINRGLMQITAQLERTGNTLRSTTSGSLTDVEKLSSRFDQSSKEAVTQLTDKTARMRVATEDVARLLGGFGDQLDVLLDRLSMAGDGIKRHEGDLIAPLQTALSHLSSVAERLETTRTLTVNVSEQAVARLSEVANTVERQLSGLSDGSQTATGLLRGVGQIYGDQTQSLNSSVNEAQDQVKAMNDMIESMQQRTDRLRVTLKLQGEELMGSLEQILQQLANAGDTMENTVDQVLQEKAAKGLQKIG